MGIQKTFTADNGAVGNYWKIIGYSDIRSTKVSVTLVCYKDKAFSDALKAAPKSIGIAKDVSIGRKTFQIAKPTKVDYIANAYENLMLDPFFVGATNILESGQIV